MKRKVFFLIFFIFLVTLVLNGQKSNNLITIHCVVKDSLQRAVKGAEIFVDNIETSSTSDRKGNYKIEVKPEAEEILIVYPHCGAAKTKINGRRLINFTLLFSEMKNLDSSVYIVKSEKSRLSDNKENKKKENSGSASKVSHRFSSYNNIFEMIRGELSNVVVRGTSVYAQGISTFGGNSEVLFVVDGIVVEQINDVVPVDVKSIRLIKGPETAAYGMRGANGVIIITTFRGSDNK